MLWLFPLFFFTFSSFLHWLTCSDLDYWDSAVPCLLPVPRISLFCFRFYLYIILAPFLNSVGRFPMTCVKGTCSVAYLCAKLSFVCSCLLTGLGQKHRSLICPSLALSARFHSRVSPVTLHTWEELCNLYTPVYNPLHTHPHAHTTFHCKSMRYSYSIIT